MPSPSLVGTASSLLQNNCMQESITKKSIVKTAGTHNIKMQSNKRKRVQERISCDNVVSLLFEGEISKKEVREQLYALQAPIDYKKWISAIQASECTRAEEPMPPPAKRVRLFDRMADSQYGGQQSKQQSNPSLSTYFSKIEREAATQKAIQKAKDEALGAVVVRMLEDIPKKNSVIKAFIPKSGSDYLRSRARDVGDGYIVSIVRPVTDHSTQILVTLPEKYQDDFVLLGNEGPMMVDSEEAYNHVKENIQILSGPKMRLALYLILSTDALTTRC